MRKPILAAVLVISASAALAEEPGNIVIRPKGAPAPIEAPPVAKSEKDSFIVIRPNGAGAKPGQQLVSKTVPKRESTPPRPYGGALVPILNPKPQGFPKPAENPDPQRGKLVLETWDAAYLKGAKVGYFHIVVRERELNGKTYLYATREHKLMLKRFGQVTEQSTEDATLETPDGRVLTTRMELALGPQQRIVLTGKVVDGVLKTQSEGVVQKVEETPWPDDVLGVSKEATLYKDRKPKVGDRFDYFLYEGRLNRVMKVTVEAKALESIALFQGQPAKPMLRLTTSLHPLKDKDGKVIFRVPPATVWCDAESYEVVRTDQDMPSLGGRLIIARTTKEAALATPTNVPDLFDVQSIRLDRDVPGIHDMAAVVYRILADNDPNPEELFAQDARQSVANFDPKTKTYELRVTAIREPRQKPDGVKAPGEEHLGKSFFVDWDDANVRRHAAAAVAGLPAGADDWRKAKAIERWVKDNMRAVEFSQSMGTASSVAKSLSGDCTEYAMLATAICRANGIPSRTALGLVYAPVSSGKPFLAYHMWFEVYVGGDWVALDATLGKGSVGPGHLKITDHHWHEERTLAPLLPVLRALMATPKVEVVK